MIADLGYSGMRTLTFSTSNQTYTTDGTVNVQDKMTAGATATLAGAGIERSNSCCRPTAGTLTVTRVGGQAPGQHIWTFGVDLRFGEARRLDGHVAGLRIAPTFVRRLSSRTACRRNCPPARSLLLKR